MKNIDDKVRRAMKGDKNCLVELVMERKDQMYRIAYSYFNDEEKTLDVMQDTIVKAFRDIKNLREVKFFYTWYIRILINTCKERIRQGIKIVEMEDYIDKVSDNASTNLEDILDIKRGIAMLKEEFREVVMMKYIEDLSIKEISQVLNLPEGTVKSRLFYALKELKGFLGVKEGKAYGM